MWEDEWRYNVTIASNHAKHHDGNLVFENKQSIFDWIWCLSLLKNFTVRSILLSFIDCDKNCPFLILYAKYQMSSCTTCLIRNADTPLSLAMDLIYFLISLLIMVPTSEISELSNFLTHNWTPQTLFESSALSSNWQPSTVKSLYWSLHCKCHVVQMLFLNFWRSKLRHGVSFFTDNAWL